VVSIRPCHGRDPGSIPGNGTFSFFFFFVLFLFFFHFLRVRCAVVFCVSGASNSEVWLASRPRGLLPLSPQARALGPRSCGRARSCTLSVRRCRLQTDTTRRTRHSRHGNQQPPVHQPASGGQPAYPSTVRLVRAYFRTFFKVLPFLKSLISSPQLSPLITLRECKSFSQFA
jgi:hypothetical protein